MTEIKTRIIELKGLAVAIKALDGHVKPDATVEIIEKTIALLTEMAPRVITLEEALKKEICWVEINDRLNLIRPAELVEADFDEDTVRAVFAGGSSYLDRSGYGKDWRCWNTWPDMTDGRVRQETEKAGDQVKERARLGRIGDGVSIRGGSTPPALINPSVSWR